jgi:hypothetical protein
MQRKPRRGPVESEFAGLSDRELYEAWRAAAPGDERMALGREYSRRIHTSVMERKRRLCGADYEGTD